MLPLIDDNFVSLAELRQNALSPSPPSHSCSFSISLETDFCSTLLQVHLSILSTGCRFVKLDLANAVQKRVLFFAYIFIQLSVD